MEGPNEQLNTLEQTRQNLAEKVKVNLEKYKEEIKDLAFFTSSSEQNGFYTTRDLTFVNYKEEHDTDFEVQGTPKEDAHSIGNIEEPTYIYHKKMNWGSFYAPLGSCLHTPDRPGNIIGISMKGEKGERFNQELIDSIFDLIKTIKKTKNLKEIAIEAIPVFEAFKNISEKFPSNGRISVQSMIDEYNEILNKHN